MIDETVTHITQILSQNLMVSNQHSTCTNKDPIDHPHDNMPDLQKTKDTKLHTTPNVT